MSSTMTEKVGVMSCSVIGALFTKLGHIVKYLSLMFFVNLFFCLPVQAVDIATLSPDDRKQYYGELIRELQTVGGEYATDQLLLRAGPCLEQCPVGLHTFSQDRVTLAGFATREFHYDREAVRIRFRDEPIFEAVKEKYQSVTGVDVGNFELINSKEAAEVKLKLFCGIGVSENIERVIEPFGEVFMIRQIVGASDAFDQYLQKCELKKLDLYPNALQLSMLEDFLGLKRKLPEMELKSRPIDEQLAAVTTVAEKLLTPSNHLLLRIIGESLTALNEVKGITPTLLQSRLLQYMEDAASYLLKLNNPQDLVTYDELGLTYEHLQDLIYTYLAHTRPYIWQQFAQAAQNVSKIRINTKVPPIAFPTQSGMGGFAMAYAAANHVLKNGATPGNGSFPASVLPLGKAVLGMYDGIYFETRFGGGPQSNIIVTGLASEHVYTIPILDKVVTSIKQKFVQIADQKIAIKPAPIVLIIDATLPDVIKWIDKPHSTSTNELVSDLRTELNSGNLDIILVKSLQKFGSLGTRKVKAGSITIYSKNNEEEYSEYLTPFARELFTTRGDEFQFTTHNLYIQEKNEREYYDSVSSNAALLKANFNSTSRRFPKPSVVPVRTFVLTDQIELRNQASRTLSRFGTFGGPYSSHSDMAHVERFSPGLEPENVLFEKFAFLVKNIPQNINLQTPVGPKLITDEDNISLYKSASAFNKAPFTLYQNGRPIFADQPFNYDFSRPGYPVDIIMGPPAFAGEIFASSDTLQFEIQVTDEVSGQIGKGGFVVIVKGLPSAILGKQIKKNTFIAELDPVYIAAEFRSLGFEEDQRGDFEASLIQKIQARVGYSVLIQAIK